MHTDTESYSDYSYDKGYSYKLPPSYVDYPSRPPGEPLFGDLEQSKAAIREAPNPTLFSSLSLSQKLKFLIPGILLSGIAGGVVPFMTIVVGQVFNALAVFTTSDHTDATRKKLLHDVGIAAAELVGLGVGTLLLTFLISSIWIRVGEYNVAAIRRLFYQCISGKEMAWFDMKHAESMDQDEKSGAESVSGAAAFMEAFRRLVHFLCFIVLSLKFLFSGTLTRYAWDHRWQPDI
jgi:hypothetical protein